MLHIQGLKQKGPRHLRNAFHIKLIIPLEILEILSCDPVTNYCSKEKKSRTEWNSEKVQDVKLIFFPFYSMCKLVCCGPVWENRCYTHAFATQILFLGSVLVQPIQCRGFLLLWDLYASRGKQVRFFFSFEKAILYKDVANKTKWIPAEHIDIS